MEAFGATFCVPFDELDCDRLSQLLTQVLDAADLLAAQALVHARSQHTEEDRTSDLNQSFLDENSYQELEVRMAAFSLRLMLGQGKKVGRSTLRKAFLDIATEVILRRDEKSDQLGREDPVFLTARNVASVAMDLTRKLQQKLHDNAPSMEERPLRAQDLAESLYSTQLRTLDLGMSASGQSSISHLRIAPPPRQAGSSQGNRYIRPHLRAAQQRSRRPSPVFKPEVAWENQLRKSAKPKENSNSTNKAIRSLSTSKLSPLAQQPNMVANDHRVYTDAFAAKFMRRGNSPRSTCSAPIESCIPGVQQRKKQAEADARRRRAQEYGNFYSMQNARNKSLRRTQNTSISMR